MKKNTQLLGEADIGKLLFRLSLPATVGMLVMSLYNIVDTIFVGRGVGSMAIAGLSIVFPIQMIINSAAMMLGIGGSSIISRAFGAKDFDKANKTFGNLILFVLFFSLLITPLALIFIDSLLMIFGAHGEILPYAREYLSIVLFGTPFLNFSMMANNLIRAEGNAKVAMITMIVPSVINLILDPIFIFGMNLGVSGAAYATVIANIGSGTFCLLYFKSGHSSLKFYVHNLKPDFKILKETIAIGSSSFAHHVSSSITTTLLNHSLVFYGGEIAVAVYGVIHKILMLAVMPLVGVVQGFLPIAGYNYGAKQPKRFYHVLKISVITNTIMAIIGFLAIFFFAGHTFRIFDDDPRLIEGGATAIRIIILAFPLVGFQTLGSGLFQAMGKAWPSFFLSITRQIVFLIPLVIVLPLFWGLNGIWYSFPIADLLGFLVSFFMVNSYIKKSHK